MNKTNKSSVFSSLNVHLAPIHYPVYNKSGKVVATSITNFDVHDIARVAKTYGLKGYFLVTPLDAQLKLIDKIIKHWVEGGGQKLNPLRGKALKLVKFAKNIEDMKSIIEQETGQKTKLVGTSAKIYDNSISFDKLSDKIFNGENLTMLFGTGFGMTKEVMDSCDYILEPIKGEADFNHLSVRSAVSIIIDRLISERRS